MNSDIAAYLFVYGTLRRAPDGVMHPLLQDQAEFIADATLPGALYEISGYPGAVPSSGNSTLIIGELYLIAEPEPLLRRLDDYEECSKAYPAPREYSRAQYRVSCATGDSRLAWVYAYNRPTDSLERIVSGDYRQYWHDIGLPRRYSCQP